MQTRSCFEKEVRTLGRDKILQLNQNKYELVEKYTSESVDCDFVQNGNERNKFRTMYRRTIC
jgi:hypothetical protein